MTGKLILVMGDQLSRGLTALAGLDPARDRVLMLELADEGRHVPHHRQKIALVLSAMRHFAEELRAEGIVVDYIRLDDPHNTQNFTGELRRAVARHRPHLLVLTTPGEWRIWEMVRRWPEDLGLPVEIRRDDRFFCPVAGFAELSAAGKTARMETFYRVMRARTGLLMEAGKPLGGKWNFDADNRKALPRGHLAPARLRFPPDAVTREVMDLVARQFPDHFGDLEGFGWPVSRAQARAALEDFVTRGLPHFGDWQDAMQAGAPFLYHALIAPALNLGLLTASEVCKAAEAAFHAGTAPLNAVEGFIRQILGWREFVRGLYWTEMPGYAKTNALGAFRPLPGFYWSGQTDMRCMAEVIGATRAHAYAHHIQRLMVTGNFALLAGLAPAEVEAWYLAVYADAFEWVELPNTHGMALHADGGRLGSKPYAASAAYIARMSDYCSGCRYDGKARIGPGACPFNFLYWNFLITHRARFARNPRMALPYRTLDRFDPAELAAIRTQAEGFLAQMDAPAEPGAQALLDLW